MKYFAFKFDTERPTRQIRLFRSYSYISCDLLGEYYFLFVYSFWAGFLFLGLKKNRLKNGHEWPYYVSYSGIFISSLIPHKSVHRLSTDGFFLRWTLHLLYVSAVLFCSSRMEPLTVLLVSSTTDVVCVCFFSFPSYSKQS